MIILRRIPGVQGYVREEERLNMVTGDDVAWFWAQVFLAAQAKEWMEFRRLVDSILYEATVRLGGCGKYIAGGGE